jgi:predicted metal-dependent peptidase
LARVLAEVDRLRSVTDCRLTLLQCDAAIQAVEEYEGFEGARTPGASVRVRGRGGTDFRPVFAWVAERWAAGVMRPDGLIYLTDGFGRFPDPAPAYPVLWVVTPHGARDIPFGAVLRLSREP